MCSAKRAVRRVQKQDWCTGVQPSKWHGKVKWVKSSLPYFPPPPLSPLSFILSTPIALVTLLSRSLSLFLARARARSLYLALSRSLALSLALSLSF